MKKAVISLVLVLIFNFLAVFSNPIVFAADEVKLVKDGSTYYLSTEGSASTTRSGQTYRLVPVEQTAATSAAKTASRSAVVPPPGYVGNIGELISFLLKLVMIVAILLILLAFITAGFEWITSGGDKGKTESARNRIVAAFVGVLILSAAYALTLLVAYVLGFDSIDDVFGSIKRINP
jgi:hypothetical protein